MKFQTLSDQTLKYEVLEDNRDKGKVFLIEKMSAFQLEWFSIRAIQAALKAGFPIPKDLELNGTESIINLFGLSIFSSLDKETLKELHDELKQCVKFMPDPKNPSLRIDVLNEIEEQSTIFELRKLTIDFHIDFFAVAVLWFFRTFRAAE